MRQLRLLVAIVYLIFCVSGPGIAKPAKSPSSTLTPPEIQYVASSHNVIKVSWTAVPGATSYKIYYGTTSGFYSSHVNAGVELTYKVGGLQPDTLYYVAVAALNDSGEGPLSAERSVRTLINSLPYPELTSVVVNETSVNLQWTSPNPRVLGFVIYYRFADSPQVTGAISVGRVTSHTVSGLQSGSTYYFSVAAKYLSGESPRSNELSATIPSHDPLPVATISLDPQSIIRGHWASLGWECVHATVCELSPEIGGVDMSGTITVAPIVTTTYTVTATGPGGTASGSATLTVIDTIPTVSVSATPQTIEVGGSAILSWNTTNATALHIDNGVGLAALNGSQVVSPTATTTYTLTANGPSGSANAAVTVFVTVETDPLPEGTFGGEYQNLIPPDSTVKTYSIERFAVVRGEVRDKDNNPIPGVAVVFDRHRQYGTAKTDADGKFALPVDKNGILNVSYTKQGYINVHRQVNVSPNDIAITQTITMLKEDSRVTRMTLDGDPTKTFVHQGSPVEDASGRRQASVVVAGNNRAFAVDKNGQDMFELTTLNLRATEFDTPASMPAVLPPTTAFTYCAELSSDGVERVRFQEPVAVYVDNFLGFDVGEIVPVGYYDRDRGVWVPSENGRVVRLLDRSGDGIVDALDANGDGQPDDLNGNGDFSDEVRGLDDPAVYAPGKTFWRATVKHFTPWDFNWPMFPPVGAIAANATGKPVVDQQKKKGSDCDKSVNSYVNCRSRIYHEDIEIPGTGVTLHYASNRVPDFKTVITVPASGATVPTVLKRIVVRLNIGGRTFEQTLPAAPDQSAEFIWDGLDFMGQRMDMAVAKIDTEFVYNAVYGGFRDNPSGMAVFGQPGVYPTMVLSRDEFIIGKNQSFLVHNQSQKREALVDGWTLSNHHFLSAMDLNNLYKGNGELLLGTLPNILSRAAGNSMQCDPRDGVPAVSPSPAYPAGCVWSPSAIAFDLNGNTYIAQVDHPNWPLMGHRIRKIDDNGILTTIAGSGGQGYSGDGGLATLAKLDSPMSLVADDLGNLYVADSGNHRIRKISTDGIISTIAGTGVAGFSGDGGPAVQANLSNPVGLAIDQSQNIYISDSGNRRIRKIDFNGNISTFAGTGQEGFDGDGGPAILAQFFSPQGLSFNRYGELYIVDGVGLLKKVDTNGVIHRVAGGGGSFADGIPAVNARLGLPTGVAIDKSSNIFITEPWAYRVRMIDAGGIIKRYAGTGVSGSAGDGGPAIEARFRLPWGVAVNQRGDVYIADWYDQSVYKIHARSFLSAAQPEDMIFEEEGRAYTFSLTGQHKQTIDLDTQKVIEEFEYDVNGRLIASKDHFNNRITIERNAAGVPTAIVSPDGVRTLLSIDANNHLKRITYPDGSHYDFEYTPGGLLTKQTQPNGNFFTNTYDATGRITDAQDQLGGHEQFTRQVAPNTGDVTAKVTSAEGTVIMYQDKITAGGGLESTATVSGVTNPLKYTRTADEMNAKVTRPDMTVQDYAFALDPQYAFKYLKSEATTLPSGLKAQVDFGRTYVDTNSDNTPDKITRTVKLNTNTTTVEHNVLTSTFKVTSPLSRTMTAIYDPATLLTAQVSVPGLLDTAYTYDTKGRVTGVTSGTRAMSLTYDTAGNLESVTDPRNNRTEYTYDAVGRVKSIKRADLTHIRFTYDANGNMTVLTNPSNKNHGYIYNNVNLPTEYNPPVSPATKYVFDKERRLSRVEYPSGKTIRNIYDNGLLTRVETPEGDAVHAYLPSGQLASVSKNGEVVSFTYDGSLLKSVIQAGTIGQTIAMTYNTDFRLTGLNYAGSPNALGYDNDGLLTSSGRFTITRAVNNGLPTAVSGGALSLTRAFNGHGELSSLTQKVNNAPSVAWSLTYNNNGQITAKTETVGGVTANYAYTYDTLGRLTHVEKDSTLVEEYRYNDADPLGTRTWEMNTLRGIAGRALTYNAEDQLLSVGGVTYEYNADGFLSRKRDGAATTEYTYSSTGELLRAALPDTRVIDYVHDSSGRRIAKKINNVTVEKYLWLGLTRLLAVYDGSNNLVARFEYADDRVPYAMTIGATTYYLGYDQVGSLRTVANAAGVIVKRVDYDSFGNIITDTAPALKVPFGFAGGLHDRDTGLVRFGYRDYDPETGRWTAKDPIGFAGGDVDLYGYVMNDPVNLVDPLGLEGDPWWSWENITNWISSFSGGVEGASKITYYGDVYNEIGSKPISSSGELPNALKKWGPAAKGMGNTIFLGSTAVEVGSICLLSKQPTHKKFAKSVASISTNAAGFAVGYVAIGLLASVSWPVVVTVGVGTLALGGIGLGVSAVKNKVYEIIDSGQ